MQFIHRYAFFVAIALIIGAAGADYQENQSELKVVGEEYAPYSYLEDGKAVGISVDLIEALTADSKYPVNRSEITLLPWEEAYHATMNGSNTLLLAVYRTPERETDLQWAGPFANDSSAVFIGNDSTITIPSTADLKKIRVGVVSGDARYRMLTGYGVPEDTIVTAENVTALIPMLQEGRIDAIFYGEQAGKWAIRKATGNETTLQVALRVGENQVWFGLSPDTPAEIVDSLQASLDKKQGSGAVNSTGE